MTHPFARVSHRDEGVSPPYFSICIPQYNRTDFLIKACETFAAQSFRDFELCIADDCSNDDREAALVAYLRTSGIAFVYAKNDRNLRYDGNLRSAIALSRGRYLLLMGNDDGLADDGVLQFFHDEIAANTPVAAAICNYREVTTARVFRRMTRSGVLGSGPRLAASLFRRYSFVSGVILDGPDSRAAATASVDGSEMYQMYLGTRLVAAGGRFLAIDRICVEMGLQMPGQVVDSYRRVPRVDPCPIVERPMPLGRLLTVVATGLGEGKPTTADRGVVLDVARQLFVYIYPFWVIEYRRIQSWRFAVGMLLALRPARIAHGLALPAFHRGILWVFFGISSLASLLLPIRLFDALHPALYALAKRVKPVRR